MVYGIRNAQFGSTELREGLFLAPPAQCAEMAKEHKADIALVPVGALPTIDGAQIITSYCISSSGGVRTVVLLTDTALDNIHTIYLDTHSRTSVELAKLLACKKWGIAPQYVDGLPLNGFLKEGEAMVAIGDKVFDLEHRVAIKLDLSDEWKELTGLPFVFAVWVALTAKGKAAEAELNAALAYGVANIERALPDDPLRPRNLRYLTHSIEYELSEPKRQAMQLFLSQIS